MSSFNQVILMGNCGKDPEIRYLPSGEPVAKISLATSRKWKDKNTGEPREKTEWHRLEFFGRLAEIVEEYVVKGTKLHVTGSIQYGQYERDGVTHYTTDIRVDSMQLLGSPQQRDGEGGQQPQRQQQRQNTAPQRNSYADARGRAQPQQETQRQAPQRSSSGFDDMDDDIPF